MLKSINKYIINEYIKSLFVVIAVMLSIIFLINLLDEFNFFKSKKDLKFIFFIIFTILKIPYVLVNLFPFIILFAGIIFYLKIYNHNEVISLRVMGYSNVQIILIPALTSFSIGYIIVFLIVPFSSSMLKYYEELRSQYNETKNLIFINETGIWILDKNEKEKNIIRIEKINKDFSIINQVTIYNYDLSNNFIKRIDANEGIIKDKNWQLNKVYIITVNKKNNKENYLSNYSYTTNIDINELKNVYKNTETTSLLDINKEMLILETGTVKGIVQAEDVEVLGHMMGNIDSKNIYIGNKGVVRCNLHFENNLTYLEVWSDQSLLLFCLSTLLFLLRNQS